MYRVGRKMLLRRRMRKRAALQGPVMFNKDYDRCLVTEALSSALFYCEGRSGFSVTLSELQDLERAQPVLSHPTSHTGDRGVHASKLRIFISGIKRAESRFPSFGLRHSEAPGFWRHAHPLEAGFKARAGADPQEQPLGRPQRGGIQAQSRAEGRLLRVPKRKPPAPPQERPLSCSGFVSVG